MYSVLFFTLRSNREIVEIKPSSKPVVYTIITNLLMNLLRSLKFFEIEFFLLLACAELESWLLN